jgi:hypothetical protein
MNTDPMMSRLQLARDEIDRMFGAGHAAANPSLVIAVMNAASSDYAAQLIARSLQDIAVALVEPEEQAHVVAAHELRPRRSCLRSISRSSRVLYWRSLRWRSAWGGVDV